MNFCGIWRWNEKVPIELQRGLCGMKDFKTAMWNELSKWQVRADKGTHLGSGSYVMQVAVQLVPGKSLKAISA